MSSSTEGQAAAGPSPRARLRLQEDRSGRALLDGGWWPRSADPAAELPGLMPALDERHGRIARVMLGTADWDASRPHRLYLDGPAGRRVVKLGWFNTMPEGLLTAISARGERTDLVTIPPRSSEQAAAAAMDQAAQDGNREHSPAILAAIGETNMTHGGVRALALIQRGRDRRPRRLTRYREGSRKEPKANRPGRGTSSPAR